MTAPSLAPADLAAWTLEPCCEVGTALWPHRPDCSQPAAYQIKAHDCVRPPSTSALVCRPHLDELQHLPFPHVECRLCRRRWRSFAELVESVRPLH